MNTEPNSKTPGLEDVAVPDARPEPLYWRLFTGAVCIAVVSVEVLGSAFAVCLTLLPLQLLFPFAGTRVFQGYAWIAGAVAAIIVLLVRRVKTERKRDKPVVAKPSGQQTAKLAGAGDHGAETGKPAGFWGRMLGGAFFGAFAAGAGACILVICWLSLRFCPLLPQSWQNLLAGSAEISSSADGTAISFSGAPLRFMLIALGVGAVCGAIVMTFLGGPVVWQNVSPGVMRHRRVQNPRD